MKNYMFLTESNLEGITKYHAIDPSKIETLNVCDTYDGYGQSVGHENAGDYHIDNSYSDAKDDCQKAIFDKFGKDVSIDAHNACVEVIDNEEVDEWISENVDKNAGNFIAEINGFIAEWCENNHNLEQCEGFNYWDGSNWKSVVVAYSNEGNNSHDIVMDKKLVRRLNYAIENCRFLKEGFGIKTYETRNMIIEDSCTQGTWEAFRVIAKFDIEDIY